MATITNFSYSPGFGSWNFPASHDIRAALFQRQLRSFYILSLIGTASISRMGFSTLAKLPLSVASKAPVPDHIKFHGLSRELICTAFRHIWPCTAKLKQTPLCCPPHANFEAHINLHAMRLPPSWMMTAIWTQGLDICCSCMTTVIRLTRLVEMRTGNMKKSLRPANTPADTPRYMATDTFSANW